MVLRKCVSRELVLSSEVVTAVSPEIGYRKMNTPQEPQRFLAAALSTSMFTDFNFYGEKPNKQPYTFLLLFYGWKDKSLTTNLQDYSDAILPHPNVRMIKYNLLLTSIFSFFSHFLGLTSLTGSAVDNSSIKCQDTPCIFGVVCCTLEEFARHILEFCSLVTTICQGIFSVKGQILFVGKSKLTLVPFEIEEVRRLWYFGDSVKNTIPQELLGWKGQISSTKKDLENPWQWRMKNTHAPAHTVTLLMEPLLISIGMGDWLL